MFSPCDILKLEYDIKTKTRFFCERTFSEHHFETEIRDPGALPQIQSLQAETGGADDIKNGVVGHVPANIA